MNLELKHYRAFIVLAKTLHFGHAAERLNMAQPQLSRMIKFIESEVGVQLFARTTRNIVLTPAGEVFLDEGSEVIMQAENALQKTRKAAEGVLGSINLGYMDFAISGPLPRILRAFRYKFPNVQIVLDHLWTEQQRASLLDRSIDIGFLIGPFENPEIASVPVHSSKLMVVLPETHPLAQLAEIDLRSLAQEPFIFGTAAKWRPFRDVIDKICLDHGFLPRVVQEPFNSDAIFGLVSAQLGVTIYPERPFSMYPRGGGETNCQRQRTDFDHRRVEQAKSVERVTKFCRGVASVRHNSQIFSLGLFRVGMCPLVMMIGRCNPAFWPRTVEGESSLD